MIKIINFLIKVLVLLTLVNIACLLLLITSVILWDIEFFNLQTKIINRVFKKEIV